MKTLILILLLLFPIISTAQVTEDVGAGVIDFLLSNPTTANKMNKTEASALNVISQLLKRSSDRKHEVNVANAGKSITKIQGGGQNATIVFDTNGNLFIMSDGIIYPISKSLVEEAKSNNNEIINNTGRLPEYNLDELKRKVNSVSEKDFKIVERLYITTSPMYFSEVKEILGESQLVNRPYYCMYPKGKINKQAFVWIPPKSRMYLNKKIIPKGSTIKYSNLEVIPRIVQMFTYKGFIKTLSENPLDNFTGIKRTFFEKETINIFCYALVDIKSNLFRVEYYAKIEIFEKKTGKQVDLKYINEDGIDADMEIHIRLKKTSPGRYLIRARLLEKVTSKIVATEVEEFEVIEKKEKNKIEKTNVTEGLYLYSKSIGYNQEVYDIKKERLHVRLRIKDENQRIIWQSFTADGRLLGTTIRENSRYYFYTGPESNPIENLDFIDKVKVNGAGVYKITATLEDSGKKYTKWVEIK